MGYFGFENNFMEKTIEAKANDQGVESEKAIPQTQTKDNKRGPYKKKSNGCIQLEGLDGFYTSTKNVFESITQQSFQTEITVEMLINNLESSPFESSSEVKKLKSLISKVDHLRSREKPNKKQIDAKISAVINYIVAKNLINYFLNSNIHFEISSIEINQTYLLKKRIEYLKLHEVAMNILSKHKSSDFDDVSLPTSQEVEIRKENVKRLEKACNINNKKRGTTWIRLEYEKLLYKEALMWVNLNPKQYMKLAYIKKTSYNPSYSVSMLKAIITYDCSCQGEKKEIVPSKNRQTTEEKKLMIDEWLENNTVVSIRQCAKDTGIYRDFISNYFKEVRITLADIRNN